MDSFELNKIIGAVLGTLLFVMGVGFIAEAIYEPIEGRMPGYALPEAEPAGGAAEPTIVAAADIGTLLAAADLEEGQAAARKCQSCHSFEEGGPNGQGPNLWDIVERPIAGHPGFNYSPELVAHAAEAPTWTYEELDAFLLAPKDHVPGTKMNFGGVKNDEERGDLIAYLSTLSANPKPFPAPAETEPAEGEAQAEDEAPAADAEAAPAAEGEAPAADAEADPVEQPADAVEAPAADDAVAVPTPTELQGESPVVGTPTRDNTPAGADTPGAGGMTPAPAEAAPAAPSTEPMAPADGGAMMPSGTIEPAPAPSGTVTPSDAPAATTTTAQ